jgi:hypothetical protein
VTIGKTSARSSSGATSGAAAASASTPLAAGEKTVTSRTTESSDGIRRFMVVFLLVRARRAGTKAVAGGTEER